MELLGNLPWWAFAAAALACGLGAAASGFLGLSAGTAYGRSFHELSQTQRRMARIVAVGSMLAAVLLSLFATAFTAWALHLLTT